MVKIPRKKTAVIAGGGTGGHIYPAVAIARALQKKDPECDIHFVGSPGGLETKIVPKEGFPLHLIKVGKLNQQGGFGAKLLTLLAIPRAFLQSIALLFELKPQVVLGVGGYASGPFVLMASLLGFRSTIWEPNAHPGLTNRWLSWIVRRSLVVFPEARKYLKSRLISEVGLPVRSQIEDLGRQDSQREDSDFHILVFGGSQGARALNKIVKEMLLQFDWDGVKFVHQTGVYDFAELELSYKQKIFVQPLEYLNNMEKYYAWADLIICRAGASTVAEVTACQKPAILVPLPWAADNHQQKNAESLVHQQAGEMILQKDLTPEALRQKIMSFKNDPEKGKAMAKRLGQLYYPQAAEKIAEILLNPGDLT